VGDTLDRIRVLVERGLLLVSDHAYEELIEDGILPTEVIDGLSRAVVTGIQVTVCVDVAER
jgi:aspartate/methionine/tyrosine aminotransferase